MTRESESESETVYARSPDVLWRLGPDRVLVRRVSVPEGQSWDLGGAAALVWISLDEPGTSSDVMARIAAAGLEAGQGQTDDTIRILLDQQLIVVKPIDH